MQNHPSDATFDFLVFYGTSASAVSHRSRDKEHCTFKGSTRTSVGQRVQHMQTLTAAAKASAKVLKQHKQLAGQELQATEASWSAMASDLQEQVTDLQQRTRTLECECDELQKQLDTSDDITARKTKAAHVCDSASNMWCRCCFSPQHLLHAQQAVLG